MNRQLVRHAAMGEISRRLLVETYAPAAVLIDRNHHILYTTGSLGEFLSLPAGQPIQDLLAMAPLDLRARLRANIQNVLREGQKLRFAGGTVWRGDKPLSYNIEILPVFDKAEPLLLVCFLADAANVHSELGENEPAHNVPRAEQLEQELRAVQVQLQGALRDFEISNEEHRTINQEAVAANEAYQATIGELLDWKSDLESLGQEMVGLNGQLREAVRLKQRSTEILGNILHSIGIAVLLLDTELNIRFFTPQIAPFFHLIEGDIGRPLGDLKYLAQDDMLAGDAREVLRLQQHRDREIKLASGKKYLRRIAPYRAESGEIEGIVIAFNEIAETGPIYLPAPAERPEGDEEFASALRIAASALGRVLHNLRQDAPVDTAEFGKSESTTPPAQREEALRRIAALTARERQIMKMVVAGQPSKTIATELGISQRTVENHRAALMRKTESKSLPALARIAFASGLSDITEAPAEKA